MRKIVAGVVGLSLPLIVTPVASAFPIEDLVQCFNVIPVVWCDPGAGTAFESAPAPAINAVPDGLTWSQDESGVYEYQAPDYSDPGAYTYYYYDYQTGEYVDAPSSGVDFSGDQSYTVNY